ncbi:MAG: hypothetical protein RIE73_35220 [Coleofasciculus sp. C1-SOL-03]|jgi:hypothetical protein
MFQTLHFSLYNGAESPNRCVYCYIISVPSGVTVQRVEHELQTVSGQLATICIDRIRKLNAGRC